MSEQEQNHNTTGVHPLRRALTVAITAIVCLGLSAAYVAADITDRLPGALTNTPQTVTEETAQSEIIPNKQIVKDADTAKPLDSKQVDALVSQLATSPGMGKDYSIVVASADGTIVSAKNESTPREPASTLKTLTALAAASVLDMGSTLDTETYLTTDANSSNTNNSKPSTPILTLKGNGDMLLGRGKSDPHHTNGRAGLETLAEETAAQLKQQKLTKVRLRFDDSLFGTNRTPTNIQENNPGNLYYTPVSSMAIDGGRITEAKPADPDGSNGYPELSQNTATETALAFAELLKKQGITVEGNVTETDLQDDSQTASPTEQKTDTKAQPNTAGNTKQTLLASVQSAPLSAIMSFMLRHSDNTLAEEFGRLLALQTKQENSPEGAVKAVETELKTLGIPTEGLHMADCSGLTPGSRVTVNTLVQAQVQNLKVGNAVAAAEGLSIPGLVGTAANRLESDQAAGLMRVKTGSLGEVTSMTGNVSRTKGGTAAFTVIVNNPKNIEDAKAAINTFIAKLTEL